MLEVAPDADRAAIKRAYAARLKITHPEDDPEGFKALRQAYDAALERLRWYVPERSDDPLPEEPPGEPEARAKPEPPQPTPEADPEAAKPATAVPTGPTPQQDFWALQRALYEAVTQGGADDDRKRAILADMLGSPVLDRVDAYADAEAWIAELIADHSPGADALIEPTIRHYRWDREQGRWNVSPTVERVLERREVVASIEQLKTPGSLYHKGYLILRRPVPTGFEAWRMRNVDAKFVRPVLRLIKQEPALRGEFAPEALAFWKGTDLTKPARRSRSGGAGFVTAWRVIWFLLVVGGFLSQALHSCDDSNPARPKGTGSSDPFTVPPPPGTAGAPPPFVVHGRSKDAPAPPQAAFPATAQPGGRFSFYPEWTAEPNSAAMGLAYPATAAAAHVGGQATIKCVVTGSGFLKDCAVAEERPAGYGIGEAVKGLSGLYRMKTQTPEGRSLVGATVSYGVSFRSGAPPPKPAEPPQEAAPTG